MHILFVCTGNTCRSPMAAAIARHVAEERGLTDVVVESAGTGAYDGSTASDGALLVGMERGTDLSSHRSQPLTRALVDAADVVLVMSPQHLQRAYELGGDGKAFLLGLALEEPGNVWGIQKTPPDWDLAVTAPATPVAPTEDPVKKKNWPYSMFSAKGEAHPGRK